MVDSAAWTVQRAFSRRAKLFRFGLLSLLIGVAWPPRKAIALGEQSGRRVFRGSHEIRDGYRKLERQKISANNESQSQIHRLIELAATDGMNPERVKEREQIAKSLLESGAPHQIKEGRLTPAAVDSVTGLAEARSGKGFRNYRVSTIGRAIREVRQGNAKAFYIEMDIRNLGGLNAGLNHQGADKVYKDLIAIARKELESLDHSVSMFRHGGDECSAVVVAHDNSFSIDQLSDAMARIEKKVGKYVTNNGLQDIRHEKAGRAPGTGLHFGLTEIRATDSHPSEVIERADDEVSKNKI